MAHQHRHPAEKREQHHDGEDPHVRGEQFAAHRAGSSGRERRSGRVGKSKSAMETFTR